MMHITCLNLSRKAAKDLLDRTRDAGIRNLFVLRGDPGPRKFKAHAGGFMYAEQLVEFVRVKHGEWFTIGVAGNCALVHGEVGADGEEGSSQTATDNMTSATD